MKPRFVFLLAAFVTSWLTAQEIIKDPEFDKDGLSDCHFSSHAGTMETKIVTEDATWNRCLKVTLVKEFVEEKTGLKSEYAVAWFGRDGKNHPGFSVTPHTIYEFQFEIKGSVMPSIRFTGWRGEDFWKDMKDGSVSLEKHPIPSDEWSVVKGTFQVGNDVKYAALCLSLNAHEKWKNLHKIGSYYMVDKIQIRKQTTLLPSASSAKAGESSEKSVKFPCVEPGQTGSGFVKLRTGEPVAADTHYSIQLKDGNVIVDIRCDEPFMDKLAAKVKDVGGSVWNDDCVEIFFDTKSSDRRLNQFVVAAGGGRWMGRGFSDAVSEYDAWSAEVAREENAWTVRAVLPISLLGWNQPFKAEDSIRFLIARNRTPERETSSSALAKDGFHTITDWGYLFPNGANAWGNAKKTELLSKSKPFEKLSGEIQQWEPSQDATANMVKVIFFNERILKEELAGRKFVLTKNPITLDTQIPFVPASLANPPRSIQDRSAGNELHIVPLAITNLTEQTEEYRIVLSAMNADTSEKFVLETKDGKPYPPGKIQLLRAVRVKDGDEASHGRRYDPLVPMDLAQSVVVPPWESAPVFVQFDTWNVAPGTYRGMIRVIPLGEEGTLAKKNASYRDIPFSFEVLPFQLSSKPVVRHGMYQEARNKEDFKMMVDAGINVFQVSVWKASFDFDAEGNVTARRTEAMEDKIKTYMQWAKEYGLADHIELCFHYGALYHLFNVIRKEKIEPLTPVWEKTWVNYMAEIDAVRAKCGFPIDRWSIEILDEPNMSVVPAMTRAAELAVKANPELRIMVTWGARDIPCDTMMQLVPYVHEWCFWNTRFFTSKEYEPLQKILREKNKLITIYYCHTSARASLKDYYRHGPWTVPFFKLGGYNLYEHSSHKYRTRCWREATCGEVVTYSNIHPVTSIRNECLKAGMVDMKYYALLKECYEKADKGSELAKEMATLIESAPYTIVFRPPANQVYIDEIRERMIDLILKAQK